MIGQGPLCDAKVDSRSVDFVTVKVLSASPECGRKGALIRISSERINGIAPEEHLTKGRIAAKIGVGLAGVAALAAVPLTSSDPESWLVFNPVIPGFIMFGA